MTEAEWLAATDPDFLLNYLLTKLGDGSGIRSLRLFACACCRIMWTETPPDDIVELLSLAERHADKKLKKLKEKLPFKTSQFSGVFDRKLEVVQRTAFRYDRIDLLQEAIRLVRDVTVREADEAHFGHLSDSQQDALPYEVFEAVRAPARAAAKKAQMSLLRDIFRNPFRLGSFSPEWHTDTAVLLARQMYESREFSAMPILADALQDAGCSNDDILKHCRDANQVHVKGCWVVDLVLGKQ